jgi:hypothetical protein
VGWRSHDVVEAVEKVLVQAVAAAEAVAMPWVDAEVEVAVGRERDPDASGLVAVVEAGMWAA